MVSPSIIWDYGTHLVRTPIPDGRYGQSKHNARPGQASVFRRPHEVHVIIRGLATVRERVVKRGINCGNRCIWPSFLILPYNLLISSHFNKTLNDRKKRLILESKSIQDHEDNRTVQLLVSSDLQPLMWPCYAGLCVQFHPINFPIADWTVDLGHTDICILCRYNMLEPNIWRPNFSDETLIWGPMCRCFTPCTLK